MRRLGRVPTQIPPLVPAKKMLVKTIQLNGVPDFDAVPRGGCTPFLQVLAAPSQHQQTQLLYNSSWQIPRFETYKADPNGSILFKVNAVVQGDVLVRCFHAKKASSSSKHMVTMLHFTFNTDFFHNESNDYRLQKVKVDEATNNQKYPDEFEIVCAIEILGLSGDSLPPELSSKSPGTGDMALQQQIPGASYQIKSDCSETSYQPELSTMQGWLLYKQDGFFTSWKKWWFVARERKIMYYHGMLDATPPSEEIDIQGASYETCEVFGVSKPSQNLVFFKVILPRHDRRNFVFGTETEEELVAWCNALRAQSMFGTADTTAISVSASPPASTNQNITAESAIDTSDTLLSEEQTYAYSADEQLEVLRLQRFMCETPSGSSFTENGAHALNLSGLKNTPHGTLMRQLHVYIVQHCMGDAEQLLTELVLVRFPLLVDAMEQNPHEFILLIAGSETAVPVLKMGHMELKRGLDSLESNEKSNGLQREEVQSVLSSGPGSGNDPSDDNYERSNNQQSNQQDISLTTSSISTEGRDAVVVHYEILLTLCEQMQETSEVSWNDSSK